MNRSTLESQIPHALAESALRRFGEPRRGKVRDLYPLPSRDALLVVTSDRISAFDRVLGTVPFKGELLQSIAVSWFERTRDICRNHLLEVPDPQAMVVRSLRPVPVEVVVRGYLTGSLWRDYEQGVDRYDLSLERGLARNSAFETPLITPTTKEAVGAHDEPISERDLLASGRVSASHWAEITEKARALFLAGQSWAASRGLVLVDTKYEFGLDSSGGIWLIDEMHTPDSSRYWQQTEAGPKALDKEFLRAELIARGWMGEGEPPPLEDALWVALAERYVELYTRLEGQEPRLHPGPCALRLEANLSRL